MIVISRADEEMDCIMYGQLHLFRYIIHNKCLMYYFLNYNKIYKNIKHQTTFCFLVFKCVNGLRSKLIL